MKKKIGIIIAVLLLGMVVTACENGGKEIAYEKEIVYDDSMEIVWKDKMLEKFVRQTISKPEGTLTYADVKNVKELDLKGVEIENIDDLQYFTNLEELYLAGCKVTDISALGKLSHLKLFYVTGENSIDYSALLEMESLTKLSLACREGLDFNYMKNLEQLTCLEIYSPIKDVDMFVTILNRNPDLKELGIQASELSDFSFFQKYKHKDKLEFLNISMQTAVNTNELKEFTNLQSLTMWRVDDLDCSGLGQMTSLKELFLSECTTQEDLPSQVSKLTNLERLHMPGFKLKDISSLAGLTKLRYLDLYDNEITDLSPLSNLSSLEILDIRENPVRDVAPVEHVPQLTY